MSGNSKSTKRAALPLQDGERDHKKPCTRKALDEEIDNYMSGAYKESDKDAGLEALKNDPAHKSAWDIVSAVMAARRKSRHQQRRKELTGIAENLCTQYLHALPPRDRYRSPKLPEILAFQPFADIIQSDDDQTTGKDLFAGAMKQLPELIDIWKKQDNPALTLLPSLLPICDGLDPDRPDCLPRLNRATAVFIFDQQENRQSGLQTFIGFDDASHALFGTTERQFSTKGSRTVLAILDKLGRQDCTTAPADLDAEEASFSCMHCPEQLLGKIAARPTVSWRRLVDHFIQHSQPDSHSPHRDHIRHYSANQTMESAECYKPMIWFCVHCDNAIPLAEESVIAHVWSHHRVSNPREGCDYVQDQIPIM